MIVQSCLRSLRRDGRDAWLGSERDGAEIARAQRDFEAKRHVGKLVLMVPPAG